MIEEYCQNCKKVTGHKRSMGMGTFLGACVTLGFSLMATPFYPKRCIICGCKSDPFGGANNIRTPEQILESKEKIREIQENNPVARAFRFINRKIEEDMKR